jgi:putative spermidine/putrescine transport system substrate-binding protein
VREAAKDTGARSAQMLADKDAVLGSIWNGRLQAIADKGAPVAIEWNEHMLALQGCGIFKDAKNMKEAQLLVDYPMQPRRNSVSPRSWPAARPTAKHSTHCRPNGPPRCPVARSS